jgi:hypothetical protein
MPALGESLVDVHEEPVGEEPSLGWVIDPAEDLDVEARVAEAAHPHTWRGVAADALALVGDLVEDLDDAVHVRAVSDCTVEAHVSDREARTACMRRSTVFRCR